MLPVSQSSLTDKGTVISSQPSVGNLSEEIVNMFEREWQQWKELDTVQAREQHALRLSKAFTLEVTVVKRYLANSGT
jgi:hypothetical protein